MSEVHKRWIPRRAMLSAAEVTADNYEEVAKWCDGTPSLDLRFDGTTSPVIYIQTNWGTRRAEVGTVVVQDPIDGSFMPWEGEHFHDHFREAQGQ